MPSAPIYGSAALQPQGFDDVTIGVVPYIVNSVGDMPSTVNRILSRTTGTGDRADFMIRKGSDQIEGTFELQRATTAIALPADGATFTYDFDKSGTASTLVVKDGGVNISKEDMDVFSVNVVLVTYQA